MLPVLSARESLTEVTRHALGSGMVEKHDQFWIRAQWEASAKLMRERSEAPSDADLMAMGVHPRKARRRRG